MIDFIMAIFVLIIAILWVAAIFINVKDDQREWELRKEKKDEQKYKRSN